MDDVETLSKADLNDEARKSLKDEEFQIIKKIYQDLVSGLTVEESCVINNIDFDKFKVMMGKKPVISLLVRKGQLLFKKTLFTRITTGAKQSVDLAQWLLERRYPNEFGSASKRKPEAEDNLIKDAIDYIRNSAKQKDKAMPYSEPTNPIPIDSNNPDDQTDEDSEQDQSSKQKAKPKFRMAGRTRRLASLSAEELKNKVLETVSSTGDLLDDIGKNNRYAR